jgi:hypothetical protein
MAGLDSTAVFTDQPHHLTVERPIDGNTLFTQ